MSDEIDLKDPARRGAIVIGPARMDPRIAADQLAVVHRQPVRVARTGKELDQLEYTPRFQIVPHEPWPVIVMIRAVVADHLPQRSVLNGDPVVADPVRVRL